MTEDDHRNQALDEYVESCYGQVFSVYRLLVVVAVVYTVIYHGWWWAIGVYLGSLIAFPVVLIVIAYMLGVFMTDEKLTRLTRAYHIKRVNALIDQMGIDPSELVDTVEELDRPIPPAVEATVVPSESVIGTFMDNPIHEWVDATVNGATRRFFFDSPAQKKQGQYVMPDSDCVLYNGLIYTPTVPPST